MNLSLDQLSQTRIPFGVHEGKTFDEVPLTYLDWLSGFGEPNPPTCDNNRPRLLDAYPGQPLYGYFRRALTAYLNHPTVRSWGEYSSGKPTTYTRRKIARTYDKLPAKLTITKTLVRCDPVEECNEDRRDGLRDTEFDASNFNAGPPAKRHAWADYGREVPDEPRDWTPRKQTWYRAWQRALDIMDEMTTADEDTLNELVDEMAQLAQTTQFSDELLATLRFRVHRRRKQLCSEMLLPADPHRLDDAILLWEAVTERPALYELAQKEAPDELATAELVAMVLDLDHAAYTPY